MQLNVGMIKTENNKLMKNNKELHCHYSGLPSPSAYVDDYIDYDGMGNQGRFPKKQNNKTFIMKRLIQKISLWWSYKKSNKSRKNIWEL